MTTYKKNLVTWAWTMSACFLFGLSALYISTWFAMLFFGSIFCASLLLKRVTCAACGEPINMQRTRMPGLPFNAGPFRQVCANCGSSLKEQVSA